MKTFCFLLLTLPACALGVGIFGQQDNFISNGSFDTRGGWSGDGSIAQDPTDKNNKVYSVKLDGKLKNFSTSVTMPKENKPLVLRFRAYASKTFELVNPTKPAAFTLEVRIKDFGFYRYNEPLPCILTERAAWQEFSFPVKSIGKESCELRFAIPLSKGELLFDDFVLCYADEQDSCAQSKNKKETPAPRDVYKSENLLTNGNFESSTRPWGGDGKIIEDPREKGQKIYRLPLRHDSRGAENSQALYRRHTFSQKDEKKLFELTFRARPHFASSEIPQFISGHLLVGRVADPKTRVSGLGTTTQIRFTENDKWIGVRHLIATAPEQGFYEEKNLKKYLDFYLKLQVAIGEGYIDFDDFVLREVDPAKYTKKPGVFELSNP